MTAPVVFVELAAGRPTEGSLALLAAARSVGAGTHAVVLGRGAGAVAPSLARWGADVAWWSEDPALGPDIAAPHVDALEGLVRAQAADLVLFENSVLAADVASGLAARMEAGVNWDLQSLEVQAGELVGHRLALNDTAAVAVGWSGGVRLAVFRVGLGEPTEQPVDGAARELPVAVREPSASATVVERRVAPPAAGVPLASADVVVAGGRGLGDRQSIALLEDLAEALGGAVGVSLPIVDRGWYPQAHQVGQTGTRVRPRLYVACGISGALAHRVGMEKSGLIVAINTDPAAPIFGFCDAGVVGDLHTIVPELARLVREARGDGT